MRVVFMQANATTERGRLGRAAAVVGATGLLEELSDLFLGHVAVVLGVELNGEVLHNYNNVNIQSQRRKRSCRREEKSMQRSKQTSRAW